MQNSEIKELRRENITCLFKLWFSTQLNKQRKKNAKGSILSNKIQEKKG